jgi:ADP-ribose pyrophosphatase YjhB (NUDIX family)
MSDAPPTLIRDRYGNLRLVEECVAVLAWAPGGRLLAVSRHDDWSKYTLPGGKVDEKDRVADRLETLRRAARRELVEETGLDTDVLEPVFADYDVGRHYSTVFWAPRPFGEIRTDEPHVVRWVPPSVILAGPFGGFYQRMFATLGRSDGLSGTHMDTLLRLALEERRTGVAPEGSYVVEYLDEDLG